MSAPYRPPNPDPDALAANPPRKLLLLVDHDPHSTARLRTFMEQFPDCVMIFVNTVTYAMLSVGVYHAAGLNFDQVIIHAGVGRRNSRVADHLNHTTALARSIARSYQIDVAGFSEDPDLRQTMIDSGAFCEVVPLDLLEGRLLVLLDNTESPVRPPA